MNAAESLRALLSEAHKTLVTGEAGEAERQAKAVIAIVRAERDVAEYLAALEAQNTEENEDALRAEIMGRIHRLAAAQCAGAPLAELERLAAGEPEA
ncbi:MAG: hypothetical protein H7124_01960 [Phycisphaerales bacterium]|nr:hypothetical protein [Hyphomonadaceae bacterium]